ncbi:MAG: DUF448 domain-containing protein, partial [Bacteroidaceae bacterium]|nr:DUF448 domain-containing protein [Bacteroidaceae bacterium]
MQRGSAFELRAIAAKASKSIGRFIVLYDFNCCFRLFTGQVQDKTNLLRFTVLPDGQLVPDFKKKLSGTGVYVSANCNNLSAAVS